jgi:hypothetical protein
MLYLTQVEPRSKQRMLLVVVTQNGNVYSALTER